MIVQTLYQSLKPQNSARRFPLVHSFRMFFTNQDLLKKDPNLPHHLAPVYRICLTGGPCAGKTTALAHLTNVLTQLGFRVFCVPEAATLLMKGGAMINCYKFSFEQGVRFQTALMRTQMALEDNFVSLAKNEELPAVVFMDRGLMDG